MGVGLLVTVIKEFVQSSSDSFVPRTNDTDRKIMQKSMGGGLLLKELISLSVVMKNFAT